MKLLRDGSKEQIHCLLAESYPDVSVSSHLSTKKTDAMHKLGLPENWLYSGHVLARHLQIQVAVPSGGHAGSAAGSAARAAHDWW